MNKEWISNFQKPTYKTSNKHHDYPIFGYVINQKFTEEQKEILYKRYKQLIKKQNEKLYKYHGADER